MLFAGDRWIVDGNYGERFSRADTVIVIARHRIRCVASPIWCSTRNHGKAVQAEGRTQGWQVAFFRWIWNFPRDSRPRLDEAIERHSHLEVVELTSRDEMRRYLGDLARPGRSG